MSYFDKKNTGYREYEEMFKLKLDVNNGDFSDDLDSYNTPKTTLDPNAYLSGLTKDYNYGNQRLGFTDIFPNLNSISITPATLKIGEDVALSASATVSITDFPTNDVFELPIEFNQQPSGDPPEDWKIRRVTASHFGKLFSRNYIVNRECEVLQGYGADTFATENFLTSHFIVKDFSYPDSNGKVTFNLIDRLFFASENKNKAPSATDIVLVDPIETTSITTVEFSGSVFGDKPIANEAIVDGDEGYANIDNEIVKYKVVSYDPITRLGSLELEERGVAGGDVAAEHDAGVSVQGCLIYDKVNVVDIIRGLLNDFTNIGTGFIDDDAWDELRDGVLLPFEMTNKIVEPIAIKTLLKELMQCTGAWMYYDVIDNLIVLGYTPRFTDPVITLDEHTHILKDSMKITPQNSKQVTRAKIAYNKRDYTQSNDVRYYRNTFESRDDDREMPDKYGQIYDSKIVFANWYANEALDQQNARNVMNLKVQRFTIPPELATFKLDSRYVGDLENGNRLWFGSVIKFSTRQRIGVDGQPIELTAQVISVVPSSENDDFTIKALTYNASQVARDVDWVIPAGNYTNINIAETFNPTEEDKEYVLHILPYATIGGFKGSPTLYALDQGTFPANSTLYIINEGIVSGFGGDGGRGALYSTRDGDDYATGGKDGGNGFNMTTDVIIDNATGVINAGGGGGGGGGVWSRQGSTPPDEYDGYGGGGGGGAGIPYGEGGLNGRYGNAGDGDSLTGGSGTRGTGDDADVIMGSTGGGGGDVGLDGEDSIPAGGDEEILTDYSGGDGGIAINTNGNILGFNKYDNDVTGSSVDTDINVKGTIS